MNIKDIRTSNHETNSTDCKTDQEQQPAAELEKTYWTYSEVQAPRLWLANS